MAFLCIDPFLLCVLFLSTGSNSFIVPTRHVHGNPFRLKSVSSYTIPSSHSISLQEVKGYPHNQGDDDGSLDVAILPPEMLRDLEIGESLCIASTPIEISRIAIKPDIYVFRNFLPYSEDRQALIDEATAKGMEDAETKSGHVLHRTKSSVAWISPDEDNSQGHAVAAFMSDFTSDVFVRKELFGSNLINIENLQIARYTLGGKFDVHHDGFGRIVTVLTYLNGVAGTWFPFAQTSEATAVDNTEHPPKVTLEGKGMTEGKTPGENGVWIVGDEYEGVLGSPHTVRVSAGDAVVFYNYEYDEEHGCPIMSWRSLHAGMPVSQEKWIATNWIQSDMVAKALHCQTKLVSQAQA